MKNIKAYAVVGRKRKFASKKSDREVLGKEEIVYSGENLNQGCCDCSYTEDVYQIFKTKKEALGYVEYPPYPFDKESMKVIKVTIKV